MNKFILVSEVGGEACLINIDEIKRVIHDHGGSIIEFKSSTDDIQVEQSLQDIIDMLEVME